MSDLLSSIPADLELERRMVREVIANPERLATVKDWLRVIYHDEPRRILAAAVRCSPERLQRSPLGALTEALADSGDLAPVGGEKGVCAYLMRPSRDREDEDYLDFEAGITELQSLAKARQWRETLLAKQTKRPVIEVREQHNEMVNEATVALLGNSRVRIFVHVGRLVTVGRDDGAHRGLQRAVGAPVIEALTRDSLRGPLDDSAEWQRQGRSGMVSALPPAWVAQGILDARERPFPTLTGVVEMPTFKADGEVLERAGHDEASGLLLMPSTDFPPVPSLPDATQVEEARALLLDPLADFPFLTDADRAAAVAAMLTVSARHAIDGPSPLFAIRATAPGTGKGLLADVVAYVGNGRAPARWSMPREEEEVRKTMLSLALAGTPLVLLDNVDGQLGSNVLAMALTAQEVEGRVLGSNTIARAPMLTAFMATGNNLTFRGDLGRRVVPVDLDARREHPEDRTDFKHPDLLAWVRQHRSRLAVAALTILRAYHIAGRPRHACGPRMGSFETWDEIVRGACVWAGFGDPLGGRERIRREDDQDLAALRAALVSWQVAFGSSPHTTAEAVAEAKRGAEQGDPALHEGLLGLIPNRDRLDSRLLGYALRRVSGRMAGGACFQSAGESRIGTTLWAVRSGPEEGRSGLQEKQECSTPALCQ